MILDPELQLAFDNEWEYYNKPVIDNRKTFPIFIDHEILTSIISGWNNFYTLVREVINENRHNTCCELLEIMQEQIQSDMDKEILGYMKNIAKPRSKETKQNIWDFISTTINNRNKRKKRLK